MKHARSLVLLSGGIDSYVALALERSKGVPCVGLSFDYDGRNEQEVMAVREIVQREMIPHYSIRHPEILISESSRDCNPFSPDNLLYYSLATCFARNNGFSVIVGGQNKDDIAHATDANKEFYERLNSVLGENCNGSKIVIVQPLLHMTKAEVIQLGLELKLSLEITWSCERNGQSSCGLCSSCRSREILLEQATVSP